MDSAVLSGSQCVLEDAHDPAQKPRDLHLADADLGRDLGLAPVIAHPPAEDQLVPRGEVLDRRAERLELIDQLDRVLLVRHQAAERHRGLDAHRSVERDWTKAAQGTLRIPDIPEWYADTVGQLLVGRPAVQPRSQLTLDGIDGRLQVLNSPRRPNTPRVVPEMP